MRRAAAVLVALPALLVACALPPEMQGAGPGAIGGGALPPPGFGTMRQDEVSIAITSGDLRILVTPLAESVTRVTAPDTYRRLSGVAQINREAAGGDDAQLFLVSFFSEAPDVVFIPEELQMMTRGLRVRPEAVVPVTPGWGQRRLRQRETEMAVYGFPATVDLESDLVVEYGQDLSREWSRILLQVQAERARARARAGGLR